MSFSHQVTFCCDACETNFMIDDGTMEIPPSWLALQVVIADVDGCIPDHEREIYCHFCSQECLVEYSSSNEMRRRLALADSESKSDNDNETEAEDGKEEL
jgi:hypothetical protein